VFIDLVNLRSEEYAADSRVPVIEIGTPEQDAMRRDLTVNALFYNINTGQIEDLTGKGISDLQARICRTPLDPLQTFMDDPLRVLRAVRFARRFDL
jgi:tRNA nucleotidyltransferase (CCA-adding enzyme)